MRWQIWLWLSFTLLLTGCEGSDGDGTGGQSGGAQMTSVGAPHVESPPSFDLRRGEAVFKDKCLHCHEDGVYDAPRLGDTTEWKPRLDQGLDTLIDHAIEGHGRMPPRGGFFELSDMEIAAAVAYVVDESKSIILARDQQLASRCHPIRAPEKCSPREAEEVLTLHMLWLLATQDKR